jgi:hypothetical protein
MAKSLRVSSGPVAGLSHPGLQAYRVEDHRAARNRLLAHAGHQMGGRLNPRLGCWAPTDRLSRYDAC